MEENKKLDDLFKAVREAKPVIGFEEVPGMLNDSSSLKRKTGLTFLKGFFAFGVLMLAGLTAFYFISGKNEEKAVPVNAAENIEERPVNINKTQDEITGTENTTPVSPAKTNEITPGDKAEKKPAEANEKLSTGSIKESTFRTVSISNSEGNFKLKFKEGNLKEIRLNDEILPASRWGEFDKIIAEGINAEASLATPNKKDDGNKNFMEQLKVQLIKDGLINSSITSLQFNKEGLFINGNATDAQTHEYYLDFYKKKTGKEIGATNFTFKVNQ